MEKTEKRTAEEILEFQLNYSSMLFTDEMRSLYKRHAERAMHEYAAQELDAYKARLKAAIRIDYKVIMLRSQGLRTAINVDSVYELIDKL